MATSEGLISAGITVAFTGDDTGNLTGELTDINKDPEQTDQVDITHQQSPDKVREFGSGLTNAGLVTIAMNLTVNDVFPAYGEGGTLVVTIPVDATTSYVMTVKANCAAQGGLDGPLGDKLSREVQFQLKEKPAWATSP